MTLKDKKNKPQENIERKIFLNSNLTPQCWERYIRLDVCFFFENIETLDQCQDEIDGNDGFADKHIAIKD